jgi:hypothetical protein
MRVDESGRESMRFHGQTRARVAILILVIKPRLNIEEVQI